MIDDITQYLTFIPAVLLAIECTLFLMHVVPVIHEWTNQKQNYLAHIRGGTRWYLFGTEFISVTSTLVYIKVRGEHAMMTMTTTSHNHNNNKFNYIYNNYFLSEAVVLWSLYYLLVLHSVLHFGYAVSAAVNRQGLIQLASDQRMNVMSLLRRMFLLFDTSSHIIAIYLLIHVLRLEVEAIPFLISIALTPMIASLVIYRIISQTFYTQKTNSKKLAIRE